LHLDEDNCAKYADAQSDAYASYDYEYLLDYFYDNYLDDLADLIGWPDITDDDMSDICGYIYWANIEGLELNFTITDEVNAYC